jgi:hypothetical protein
MHVIKILSLRRTDEERLKAAVMRLLRYVAAYNARDKERRYETRSQLGVRKLDNYTRKEETLTGTPSEDAIRESSPATFILQQTQTLQAGMLMLMLTMMLMRKRRKKRRRRKRRRRRREEVEKGEEEEEGGGERERRRRRRKEEEKGRSKAFIIRCVGSSVTSDPQQVKRSNY